MNTSSDNRPDEHGAGSPQPDPGRAVLPLPEPWRFVYERISEGHAAAVVHSQAHPGDAEAAALLHASSAAVRAFRQVYEQQRMAGLAAMIGELGE